MILQFDGFTFICKISGIVWAGWLDGCVGGGGGRGGCRDIYVAFGLIDGLPEKNMALVSDAKYQNEISSGEWGEEVGGGGRDRVFMFI